MPLEFLGFFSAYGMRLMETVSIRLIKEVGTLRVDFLFLFVNQGFFFNQKKRYYEKDFAGGPFLLNQSNDLSHTYIHTYIYIYIYIHVLKKANISPRDKQILCGYLVGNSNCEYVVSHAPYVSFGFY